MPQIQVRTNLIYQERERKAEPERRMGGKFCYVANSMFCFSGGSKVWLTKVYRREKRQSNSASSMLSRAKRNIVRREEENFQILLDLMCDDESDVTSYPSSHQIHLAL